MTRFILSGLLLGLFSTGLAVEVSIPNAEQSAGKTFELPIEVGDLTGLNVTRFQFTLMFNPSVLSGVGIEQSETLIASWPQPVKNISEGAIEITASGADALSGSGALVKLIFKVNPLASTGTSIPLTFTNFVFNDGNPAAELNNGIFLVIQDTEAPVIISGPDVENVSANSATIYWQTNEPTNGTVEYGQNQRLELSKSQTQFTEEHRISLTNLKPAQVYYYRVRSSDRAGNGPVSSKSKTFYTSNIINSLGEVSGDPGSEVNIPLNISDITGLGLIDFEVDVKFDPQVLRFSRVSIENTLTANWRLPRYSLSDGHIHIEARGGGALSGSGTLANLVFQVHLAARVGKSVTLVLEKTLLNNGAIQVSPENGNFTVQDTQAPEFIGGPLVEKITASSVLIRWQTNERATSSLMCGENSQYYDILKSSNALVADHWLEVNGLKPDTQYFFQVSATDSSGNGPVFTTEKSFQTAAAGSLQAELPDLSISKGSQFQIPLQFQNAENSRITKWFCAIRFDPAVLKFLDFNTENTLIESWPTPTTEASGDLLIIHAMGDSALKGSGDLIELGFEVADEVGNLTETALEIEYFILNDGFPLVTTGNAKLRLNNIANPTPPEITFGPIVDHISGTKATVFWLTNVPATSEVQYGTNANYGQSAKNEIQKRVHQLTLTNLAPYNSYHFRVLSAVTTGSTPAISDDALFYTNGGREVRLQAPDFHLPPGSIFEVPVKIYNVVGLGVDQVEFTLNYDPELVLAGTATTSGTLAENWGAPFFSAERGKIHVQLNGASALPDSGTIVKIQFEVLQKSQFGQVTPLYFSNVKINEGAHENTSHLGILTVIDGSVPLVMRQPQAEILTPGSTVLTWKTDESATTIIEYGTSSFYGQELRSDFLQETHIVQLTNLEPNTLYHYRVGGTDEFGNGPHFTSRKILQTPERAPFVLSLPDVGYALNQLFWLPVTVNGARVENKIYAADFILKFDPGVLKYQQVTGIATLCLDWNIVVDQLTDSTLAVHLDGNAPITENGPLVRLQFLPYNSRRFGELTRLELAYTRINNSSEGVNVLNGYFTLSENPYPVIRFGPGVSKLTRNSAQIYWITNHPSTSKIEYGLSENYDYTLSNNNYVEYHAIDLFGLQPETEYHLKVSSVDEFDRGPAVSDDFVFQTGKGNEVRVSLPDTTLAIGKTFSIPILIENTDEKNLQQFTFEAEFDSTQLSPGGIVTEGTRCQDWNVTITRLTASMIAGTVSGSTALTGGGKLIAIQGVVNAQAEPNATSPALLKNMRFNYGLIQASTTNSTVTLIDQSVPQFTQPPKLKRTFSDAAILQWETDEPTTAIVAFGVDSVIDSTTDVTNFTTQHEIRLTNLYPQAVYTCRIGITDREGNGPFWSKLFYFETQAEPVKLSIPELSLEAGKFLHVPVLLSRVQGTEVYSFNFDLLFEGSKLVPVSVNHANSLIQEWSAPEFSTGIHELKVSASGKIPVTEEGTLVWLTFKAHPFAVPGEKGALTFQRVQINEDIDSTRTDTTWFSLTAPVSDDSVSVILPDTTLEPGAWCLYPVRVSNIGARAVFKGNFEIEYDASVLSCGGAMRAGKMLSLRTQLKNHFGTNRLRVAFETPDQLVGGGVLLRILFRIRPDAPLGGQVPVLLKNFSFNSGEIPIKYDDGSFSFFHYQDIVMGYVVERDSLNPVIGAAVEVIGENNQTYKTTESDRIGRFIFSHLDVTQQDSYKVRVSKNGYSNVDSVGGIVAGSHQLRLVLLQPDGKITGKITTPHGFPIHDAIVTASDSKGNDPAHYATTTSDAEGGFQLTGLNRVEPFRLVIQKSGFKSLMLNRLYADTTVWCVPEAYYSVLTGSVTESDGQPVADALVTITDTETQALFDTVRTDVSGQFSLQNLVIGSYALSPAKAGFLVKGDQTIEVSPGQVYSTTLEMEPGVLDHLQITGKDFIPNTGWARFRYNAWATAGEIMELPAQPCWRVNPPVAGTFEKSLFFPNPNYFCDAWIVLETADSTRKDSLRINLFAPLLPDSEIELQDYRGFTLDILPGSVSEDTLIYVTRGDLPEIQRSENSWKVIGDVYDLQPHEFYFQQPVSLDFPLQSDSDSLDVRLGHWDFERGKWSVLENVLFHDQTTLTTPISRGGLYAQLDASQELGIYDIQLVPNPFSPNYDTDGDGEPGLAIHFLVSSKASTRPFLTLKIYNLLGELVRELMVQEPVDKVQEMVVRWDGLTDHHLKARNGRYLLRMILEDTSGKKEYLKKIVLVK